MSSKDERASINVRNVVLTGFMGTGKTTVGKLLAVALGFSFVDTDALIETTNGRSIPEIFATDGEAAFRALEREAARSLAATSGQVVATGGGMLVDVENADLLAKTGDIFCLTASAENILARVLTDHNQPERPLLKVADPAQRILEMLTARQARYAQFTQIATDGLTPEAVAQRILDLRSVPNPPTAGCS